MNSFLKNPMILLVSLPLILSGCSAVENPTLKRQDSWDRRQFDRVAFLPVEYEKDHHKEAADILERTLYIQLSRIPEFHVIEPLAVRELFRHNNILENGVWKEATPQQLGEMLQADLILHIKLLNYGATYAIVQTRASAGAEMELIDANGGETQFLVRKGVAASRGLTGIPTGLSSVVLEPIRGMGIGQRRDLVRQLSQEIVDSLDPTKTEEGQQQELAGPQIHDVEARFETNKQKLSVNVTATPNCMVSFHFSGLSGPKPCHERSSGEYTGGFWFPEGASKIPTQLTIRALRMDGAATQKKVEVQSIRPQNIVFNSE